MEAIETVPSDAGASGSGGFLMVVAVLGSGNVISLPFHIAVLGQRGTGVVFL